MSKRTCTIDGCGKPHKARGLCNAHYRAWCRRGDTETPGTGNTRSAVAETPCRVEGCTNPVRSIARMMCRGHSQIHARHGTLNWFVVTSERFMEKVIEGPGGCWNWTGGRMGSASSYGQFSDKLNGRPTVYAHRMAWELYRSEIPAGLTIDHLCRNTLCVNPDHLEPVPQGENTRRARAWHLMADDREHVPA